MLNRVKLPTKKNKQVLRYRLLQYRFLLSWLLLAGLLPAYSQVLAETVLDTVTVIGTTPLHGSLQNVQRIPSSVQTADSEALERGQALNLADHLRNNFASVTINDVVSNPYQPDVQYRGFTASPLLGLPQGLSVYVEGIRFNEPFGDTVNWDLVADGAIGSINLFSGSNPVFGQNTLGGALSLKVK
ncbi:MAG: Plug domain-containing protein [Candidatus Thiodiazotropha sp. (ex Cardiolucina cf. quadrata)]|nr:Plug domain-containing protein [Candidatus Thiodiazotropha sp. (ex Cardiolucina cf. quadrata)]